MALRGAWHGAAHREGVLLSSPFRNERNGGEMPSGHLGVAWHRATWERSEWHGTGPPHGRVAFRQAEAEPSLARMRASRGADVAQRTLSGL